MIEATDPVAAVGAALRRAEADDVRAWVEVYPDTAMAEAETAAKEIAAGRDRGPLHGVPIGVKDLYDVARRHTRAGSLHFAERVAERDSACVRRLREGGAIVIGKTVTDEFALGGSSPPTRNPWSAEHVPGGSSGGSAAAVAARHVPVALGTDTAGSIRIPSSYSGAVGLKPTYGALPTDGVVPMSWSLDTAGPIASGSADLLAAAEALGLLGRGEARALATGRADGLRIGVARAALEGPLATPVRAAVGAALDSLAAAGATLIDVELPPPSLSFGASMAIFCPEAADYHRRRLREAPELFGPDARALLELGTAIPADAYVRAQRLRGRLRGQVNTALAGVDVVALPTMPCTALPSGSAALGEVEVDGETMTLAEAHLRFNALSSLTGFPAASQPCGQDPDGLPIGLQWIAGPGQERRICAAMAAFEELTGAPPRPPLR